MEISWQCRLSMGLVMHLLRQLRNELDLEPLMTTNS